MQIIKTKPVRLRLNHHATVISRANAITLIYNCRAFSGYMEQPIEVDVGIFLEYSMKYEWKLGRI